MMRVVTMLAVGVTLFAGSGCCRLCPVDKEQTVRAEPKPQTKCPVMGGEINKSLFADVKGVRVYVCCAGCIPVIQKDSDKYLAKIKASGEVPEALNASNALPVGAGN